MSHFSLAIKNKTNSFADNAMRGRITVGVAYGSSSREVCRVLLAVAEADGKVLDRPKPTVQLDEFGSARR